MAIISEKTRTALGWPQVLSALEREARTAVGRELARALPFLDDAETCRRQLARVAEARRLGTQALEIPLSDVPDVRAQLDRAAREGILEPVALLSCATLMRGAVRVRRFLHTRLDLAPTLAQEAEALSDFEPLAAEIERSIESGGTISDRASALLADLRGRARGLHLRLKDRLDGMLRDPELEEVLRDKYVSIRDERYVVPVKTSHQARLPGIVHNASQSGQTLFVEPEELIDLGNQLTIVQAMAEEEERRILASLSDAVGRRAPELSNDLAVLAELDRVGACGRLADRLDAIEPELVDACEPFVLRRVRHPLLVLREVAVVSNDVALAPGKSGLIVSGPNAGGKTVTLTAVGLSALMARAGLPIPAHEGSRVPLYERIETAIGDEGDLSKDLSTFTAHLTALKEIDAATVPGTLVCIDEIAADTDPREGAAIATAMLERLVAKGAQVLITTHLDEVKAKGLTDERFMAASVGFDFERLAPTYKLTMNVVGASSAIEIAQRVGLPESVCERARELLGGAGGALTQAVTALEEERADVERLAKALDAERTALAQAKEEWNRQRRLLEQREREIEAGARLAFARDLERARDDVRRTLAKAQAAHPEPSRGTSIKAAVEAQKQLEAEAAKQEALAARAKARADALASRQEAEVAPEALKPGMRVQVASVEREGEILDLSDGEALVAVGALKARVPVADLVALAGRTRNEPKLKRSADEERAAIEKTKAAALPTAPARIDLRGMRTDDALRELRDALDRAYRTDANEVTVVHGHGTGALKKAVREELGSSSYVASFRPGEAPEGGDGVTVVALRAR